MAGWTTLRNLVDAEFTQSVEEGKMAADVEAIRDAWRKLDEHDDASHAVLFEQLLALPVRDDFPYDEPSDYEAIVKRRPDVEQRRFDVNFDEAALMDHMHGAWLGRCVGCALGKPVESFMDSRGDLLSWQRLRAYLTAIGDDEWPLRDYIPEHSPAEDQAGSVTCRPSTRQHIAFMETDDDIRYTVLGQIVLQEHGATVSSEDIMQAWLWHLGGSMVCTAETQAYRNVMSRYPVHGGKLSAREIDWSWVATHQNPYREWIGAQIRADPFGYATPGDPQRAAALAWRDARMSHVKNGIYGEMFVAAMIAAAFALDDPAAVVRAGMNEIPRTSRLHAELETTLSICDEHGCDAGRFEAVIDALYQNFNHYHAVHTSNNAALVAAALLLSAGDFHRGVSIAVMGGWDTDCNGATVGSIIGAMRGADALPGHWTDRLHDTLYSAIVGYHPIAISECARRSVAIARQFADIG